MRTSSAQEQPTQYSQTSSSSLGRSLHATCFECVGVLHYRNRALADVIIDGSPQMGKKRGTIELSYKASNSVSYQPIPLASFRSIRMQIESSTVAEASVAKKAMDIDCCTNCCLGCCPCCNDVRILYCPVYFFAAVYFGE